MSARRPAVNSATRFGGPLPDPALRTAHDVRHLVTCTNSRCNQLGDDRHMICVRSMDVRNYYHGRCFVKVFGLGALLNTPREQLETLTLGDVGPAIARAILAKTESDV